MNVVSSITGGSSFDTAKLLGKQAQQKSAESDAKSFRSQLNETVSSDLYDVKGAAANKPTTKEAFGDFVGQTFFGQLMSSMRSTVSKPAYFHGGRGEEVFQSQLDQLMVEKISDASKDQFADPMYNLFMLQQRR